MKNLTLNNSSKLYLEDKKNSSKISPSKEGKVRFDLAEGLWEKSELASLPDRSSSALKRELSNFLNVDISSLSIHSGADEIIEVIPRIYLNPDDKAVVVVPTFDRLLSTNKKVGAQVILFELERAKNFRFDEDEYRKLETKIGKVSPKIVWLCSPNNPTGQVIRNEYIDRIAGNFPNVLVVVDEAYQEYFSFKPKDSAVSLISKDKNILVIRSFSKAFALAGARIGYAVSNPEVISNLENFRTMFNVSVSAQKQALKAISRSKIDSIKRKISRISSQMQSLTSLVENLPNYEVVSDSRTNFIFMKHKYKDLFEELYKRGFVVSDWRFSPGLAGQNYVRVSINTPGLNKQLIKILKKIN